ncbi:hypothetical protein TNCV_3474291 [Trichonephila clavipes]|nr:hypothetical protein TNCV_3474291 [Trichonephila clavipes]
MFPCRDVLRHLEALGTYAKVDPGPLHKLAQQPMKAKAYCAHLSIRDHSAEVHEQMSQSGGQSDVNPPVFSHQASLLLICRPTEEMKG